jgi:hypothetical protein
VRIYIPIWLVGGGSSASLFMLYVRACVCLCVCVCVLVAWGACVPSNFGVAGAAGPRAHILGARIQAHGIEASLVIGTDR